MGTLFWQLNDCWPVTSWSSVDYFGNWKAFQYQAKRSFEPVLISVNEEENQYKVYIVNDELKSYDGFFEMKLFDFNGKPLWEADAVGSISENSSLVHFEIPKNDFKSFELKKVVLSVSFTSENKSVNSLFYFEKPKDLELNQPNIQIKKIDDWTYEITTDVLAKNVFLSSAETHFSDNYFDLLPGEKKKITVSKPVKEIKIKSLFNTFN